MSAFERVGALFRTGPTGEVEVHRLWSAGFLIAGVIGSIGVDRAGGGAALVGSIVVTLLSAGGIWWLGERRASSLDAAGRAARSETLLDLGHSLEPIARELGRIAALAPSRRRRERSGMRTTILGAASGLTASSRLRACYFELASDGNSMVQAGAVGRAGAPKAGFVAGVRSGDAALAMVREGDFRFCENTDDSPPPGWDQSSHGEYKTFISVTVGTPGGPAGMLTLDAPNPGDLTDEDVKMLLVLGHLLGIAEQITK